MLPLRAGNLPLREASMPVGGANRAGPGPVPRPAAGDAAGVRGFAKGILAGSVRSQWAGLASGAGRPAGAAFTPARPGKRVDRSAAIVAAPGALAFAAPLKAW